MKHSCLSIVLVMFLVSCSQKKHGMGYIPIGKKSFDSLLQIAPVLKFDKSIIYPSVFTLNTPPPGDQLQETSCVAWAAEYCMYSYYIEKKKPVIVWNSSTEFSPGFAYHFIKVNNDCRNGGSNFTLGLNLILYTGCCFWDMWPYQNDDCNQLPSAAQMQEASRFILPPSNLPWFAITNNHAEIWKQGMFNYGLPIMVAFQVTESFNYMWNHGGVWVENKGAVLGNHAVCVIGYDDNKQMFKCQNSWGSGGDNGYFWVSYDLVNAGCFSEAYFFRGCCF